jgi:hypothetical protein
MRTVPRRASGRYFHTAPIISMCASTPYLLTVEYLCGSRLHDGLDFRHDRIRISFIAFDNDFVVRTPLTRNAFGPRPPLQKIVLAFWRFSPLIKWSE